LDLAVPGSHWAARRVEHGGLCDRIGEVWQTCITFAKDLVERDSTPRATLTFFD